MVFIIKIGNGLGLENINVITMYVFEFTKLCAYPPHVPSFSLQVQLMARRDGTHWRGFWILMSYVVYVSAGFKVL